MRLKWRGDVDHEQLYTLALREDHTNILKEHSVWIWDVYRFVSRLRWVQPHQKPIWKWY